ncbi:MAG: DUF1588 domain-containing protein [Phycisphaerae bacterium]
MPATEAPAAAPGDTFRDVVEPFVRAHCVKCHGPEQQKGDVRLDDLSATVGKDAERWRQVAEQVRDGLMPPRKEARPDDAQARAVVSWVAAATAGSVAHAPASPNKGNLIPHEALFGAPAAPSAAPSVAPEAATPARVWLLGPDGYAGFVRDVARGRVDGIVQPFTPVADRGIKDFAALYSIDEPTAQVLVRNAEAIVEAQTAHEMKDGKPRGKNDTVGEFVKLMDPAATPTRAQVEGAVQLQFRMAIGRPASAEELVRFVALYDRCAADGDRPAALKTVLQAVLLKTDAMYRIELGAGAGGRRMLAPTELARAVTLALGDRRESAIAQAAAKGELTSREQVAAHVRRIWDDPKFDKPRLLRFFREYFEYHRAGDVFKDKPVGQLKHNPQVLVADTDRLVRHVLAEDKDVLRTLLTTPRSFVNTTTKQNKQTRKDDLVEADVLPKQSDPKRKPEYAGGVTQVYGLAEWTRDQPVELPAGTRLGVLMQPSWLVAHSTNFDNDPVRRGRWVRERLLGGTVPDLPIGVVAQVPDEPHRTFRDRLTVTRQEQCWKCHRRMDDLGLAFENFDHYGRFRTAEQVVDPEATAKNVDKKGKPLGTVYRPAPLDRTGLVADSGDPALDGPVADPRELVQRLAGSERVRQVFVRHAFRYFMGRNETLADARVLRDADRAYVESGGSFKALVVSLLSGDAFLYRSATSEPEQADTAAGDRR